MSWISCTVSWMSWLSCTVSSMSRLSCNVSSMSWLSFCLFDLFLYVHSTIFQLCGTGLPGLNQY